VPPTAGDDGVDKGRFYTFLLFRIHLWEVAVVVIGSTGGWRSEDRPNALAKRRAGQLIRVLSAAIEHRGPPDKRQANGGRAPSNKGVRPVWPHQARDGK
jgi:hypothetical protein